MMPDTAPEMPYILLRTAQELFSKPPNELDDEQHSQALKQACHEHRLENRVLYAAEAAAVIVPEEQLERAEAEIRERYPNDAAFVEDLADNGLDRQSLRWALHRQCKVDSVLEKIAAEAPQATEVDISLFYHAHREKFHIPELREAFHILITVDDADANGSGENTRDAAWARIQDIARQLEKKPHRFADLALKHSECPTALQGGRIGGVKRGQLYEAVETALFLLRAGEMAKPVESPMGFHIVKCGAIRRAHTVSLSNATSGIRRYLNKRFKESQQKRWIDSLPDETKA